MQTLLITACSAELVWEMWVKTTVDTYGHVLPASEASATHERALEFAKCLQDPFEEIA